MKKIYVAGSVHNYEKVIQIQDRLVLSGRFVLTYNWAEDYRGSKLSGNPDSETRRRSNSPMTRLTSHPTSPESKTRGFPFCYGHNEITNVE